MSISWQYNYVNKISFNSLYMQKPYIFAIETQREKFSWNYEKNRTPLAKHLQQNIRALFH